MVSDILQAVPVRPGLGWSATEPFTGSQRPENLLRQRGRKAASVLLALGLHVCVLFLLLQIRPPTSLPKPLPETSLEIVSLPPKAIVQTEVVQPQPATSLQPELGPRVDPDPAIVPLSRTQAVEASLPPEPDRPPAPDPTFVSKLLTADASVLATLVPAPTVATDSALEPLEVAPAALAPALVAVPLATPTARAPVPARLRHHPASVKPVVTPPVAETVERRQQDKAIMAASDTPRALASAAPPAAAVASVHTASVEASFKARVRDAVQAAVHYPAAARMMAITGRARLELSYRAGSLLAATLVQSAGASILDEAAIAAARAAHYPPPPADVGDRTLQFLIWVTFMSNE